MTLPVLETARLRLRPPDPGDAAAIFAALSDWDVARWLSSVPWPYARPDAEWFIGECRADRLHAWIIEDDEGLAGTIGDDAELGYWIARRAWGRGYATEAGRAVVDHHFAETGATELRSAHFLHNTRSRHVLQKLGFESAGHRVIHSRPLGRPVAGRTLRLTREAWTAARA